MRLQKLMMLSLCLGVAAMLSACSEARYAAHVVKQIPFPGEPSKSKGYFKVGSAYKIQGRRYHPNETYNLTETGVASWYGPGFHGKMTANGEIFDKNELTAAHRTLQMPSIIRVTNLTNGRSLILRVNDRGPFAHNRILDVSERAASLLGFKNAGTARIKLEVLADASKEVAARAKAGHDTNGFEVALNQNKYREKPTRSVAAAKPLSKPEPVTEVALSSPTIHSAAIHAHKPYATPAEVTSAPLPPSLAGSKIYVQAGSFSQEQNALSLSNSLSSYGTSKVYMTRVNNKPFFRVRLGPYSDREQAREILIALNDKGNKNAVIIVD